MPWYRLDFAPAVVDDLKALDTGLAQRLFDKSKWLASNVGNLRHEPLAPDIPEMAKYAVADWRIFYSIDRDAHLVTVHAIVHRTALA